ncbi:HAD family hydrolase [Paenibacillus sp. XY044]|uniref:HAD family hydrolase n=1 Tax=Paenibacillus sp. XY044 TaxID=2026089 RepID=UPI000B97D785|nr:HAD family hydrolase [Paenibacillus sp. XY044]OZB97943.1 hypothetical protein CJP46_01875 [Paenibacillus sp. XY044]
MEAVLFDLDNTLVNRKEAFEQFLQKFIDRFAAAQNSEHHLKLMERLRSADRNGYREKKELYEEMRRTLPMKDEKTTAEDLLAYWFAEFPGCTVAMDGAEDVLRELSSIGVRIGCVTNGSARTQYAKLDRVQLRNYFDVVIVSEEAGVKKPDRRIYEMALGRLQARPENCWFVGDHPEKDAQGAAAAGLRPVLLLTATSDADAILPEGTLTINKLQELIPLFTGPLFRS